MPSSAGLNHAVGRLAPNPFGLYDMYGNATELAVTPQDRFVDRGGDAGVSAWRARSASRYGVGHPDETNFRRGFRVAIAVSASGRKPESDQLRFQGSWQLADMEKNGNKRGEADLKEIHWVFDGSKYTLKLHTTLQEGTVSLDSSQEPKQIDLAVTAGPDKDQTYHGIFKFVDDEIVLCFPDNTRGERPKTLTAAAGSGQIVYVLKRKKPE